MDNGVQFSVAYCQIKEVLKMHTVGFQTIPSWLCLIYRSKLQAWTRIEQQYSFGTNVSNKRKEKQHVHIHLQRTRAPALYLQNRPKRMT